MQPISIIIFLAHGIERYEVVKNFEEAAAVCQEMGGLNWSII